MSTKTNTTNAPSTELATHTLCAYLSRHSARYGHLNHGPRVTNDGELIIDTVHTANDAIAWIRARAGEWGKGKVQTQQLAALTERVKSVDPDGAAKFTEAAKGKGAKGEEPSVMHWMGEDPHAPWLSCPERIGLTAKEFDAVLNRQRLDAGRELAAYRKYLARV